MTDEAKREIEQAARQIGADLGVLLKSVQKNASYLTESQVHKVFSFLRMATDTIETKALDAIELGKITGGVFSLDMDEPVVAPQPRAERVRSAPAREEQSKARREPAGRKTTGRSKGVELREAPTGAVVVVNGGVPEGKLSKFSGAPDEERAPVTPGRSAVPAPDKDVYFVED